MWRQKDLDSEWTSVTVANNSKFVVSGTPTFVPYELKVQAANDYGVGPEPAVALGFSGEDRTFEGTEINLSGVVITSSPSALSACTVPVAAPGNVQAMVLNSTVAEIHWDPVPSKLLRGHLKGFKVHVMPGILLYNLKFRGYHQPLTPRCVRVVGVLLERAQPAQTQRPPHGEAHPELQWEPHPRPAAWPAPLQPLPVQRPGLQRQGGGAAQHHAAV